MNCPTCPNVTLVMADRQGIEIDYCPQCRGVWLDRGELDKLIERSTATAAPPPRATAPAAVRSKPAFEDSDYPSGHHRRKKSWLSDIFD